MLTRHCPVTLSFISTNLPILTHIEAVAILYQRENQKFHLLFKELEENQIVNPHYFTSNTEENEKRGKSSLWIEISPYRVIMTQQGEGKLNYRHFWETGVYGVSRYWLHSYSEQENQNHSFRLRNFTRSLTLKGKPLPRSLRIEYELWSDKLNLGHYILHLEIN
jgi:hypothetical protein